MSEAAPVRVAVVHDYAVARELVFDAWLDPSAIGRWMFGPDQRDEQVLKIALDGRVGGQFSFLVERQGRPIDHIGVYRVVDRPRSLEFTWGVAGESQDESLVRLDFAAEPGGCRLMLTHKLPSRWAEYADRTQTAWTGMLQALARWLDA